MDELDAIGRRRGSGNVAGGHDEREQTLNQLLIEMDGFDAREAVIVLAARKGHDKVMSQDFAEALEKIALGAERRLTLLPEERERVAYHESGHALLGLLQEEGDPVRRVTIVPRGQALGVTLSVPEDDRYNYGEPYLRARIVSALAGAPPSS